MRIVTYTTSKLIATLQDVRSTVVAEIATQHEMQHSEHARAAWCEVLDMSKARLWRELLWLGLARVRVHGQSVSYRARAYACLHAQTRNSVVYAIPCGSSASPW